MHKCYLLNLLIQSTFSIKANLRLKMLKRIALCLLLNIYPQSDMLSHTQVFLRWTSIKTISESFI